MKKWMVAFILGIILLVGGLLRYDKYTVWPREGATFDEFAWTFQGLSILNTGIPVSWSPHMAYTNTTEYYNPQGAHFRLVTPYLEHPALFGLVAGGFAKFRGVNTFDQVTIAGIRPLALIMGIVSILAVFFLTNAVYGEVVGLLAAGIYAIIPTVVIGSRLVQNENFFIPLFLFAIYFAYRYIQQSGKTKTVITPKLVITSLLCGLLVLAKIPWIAATVAVAATLFFTKHWKAALVVIGSTIVCLGIWLFYGYSTDATLFSKLWQLQLARYDMSFDSLFTLFRDPITVDRLLVDGWIYFGWVSVTWLCTKGVKKHAPIIFGFLAYFCIFVFAIPSEPSHGWYRYPFYPFLAMSLAVFFKEHFNKNYLATALSFIVVGLSMFANSWEKVLGFSYPVFRTYLIAVGIGALPGVISDKKIEKFSKVVNYCLIICIFCLTIWTIVAYNEQ